MDDSKRPRIANVYRGTFIHSTQQTALQILEDELLGVDTDGKIAFTGRGVELDRLSQTFGFSPNEVIQLAQHEFFMPGLVDTHIHACQYSYAGTALDMPLLQWLKTYTFPVESHFKDLQFAHKVYSQVVHWLLKWVQVLSIDHRKPRLSCVALCKYDSLRFEKDNFGQRALVGKVCMDRNDSVKHYKETSQESQEETCRFIAELLKKKYPLVRPVVTPRFALSCTEALLGQLGAIAKNNNLHIQTVMAHGCYLSDEELVLFRETGASLAHCPNSNISLCSGMLNVRNVLNHKVKLGLGTDVAGGYSASMLDAVRRALDTSKVLTIQNPEYETLSFEEVFRLATLGGSQALSLDDQTGNFEVGKDFDALRVNVAAPGGPIDLFQGEDPKLYNYDTNGRFRFKVPS
ncbi:Guanine deaminase [Liparis tanakae]|uniref:Guanine deaminase n=1 Tax=Liparis tanakae TaxID=230148 RepID=A0A4Z2I8K2_9TELE|nr:Guanine deaminase [Liparis tanakae]